jgi:hypothetical protein
MYLFRVSNDISQRMMLRVPCLRHAGDAAGQIATQEREDRGKAPRQLAWLIPGSQVIALVAAEPLILDEEDQGKGDGPVTEQADEIANNGCEVVLANNGEDGDDESDEEGPDEAGDGVKVVAEQLHGQATRVVDGDVIAEDREHEHDEAELGPANGVIDFTNQTAEAVVIVSVAVGGVLDAQGGVAEAGADNGDESGGDEHAE